MISLDLSLLYFFRQKSKAFEHFKAICSRIQNKKGCSIVQSRSDRRRKFDNVDFDILYDSFGIRHQIFVFKTPQQYRVAKRKNRVLVLSCFMHMSCLCHFWAEAFNCSYYTINRVFYSYIKQRRHLISYGLIKKPCVRYFRLE